MRCAGEEEPRSLTRCHPDGSIGAFLKGNAMRNLRLLLVVALGLAGGSTAAYASCSASFLGECSWSGGNNPADCGFSIVADCGNAISSACHIDFGDGSSTNACSLAYHTYSTPASDAAETVTFTLTCTDNCTATASRYVCFTIGTSGCIEANKGWN